MHTPGPWERDGRTIYKLEHARWHKGESIQRNRFDARVQGHHECPPEEVEAVAQLMQAAPDMLAALRKVVALCENIHPENDFDSANLLDATDAATDAIAKATGKL